jgi:hypothetical protein
MIFGDVVYGYVEWIEVADEALLEAVGFISYKFLGTTTIQAAHLIINNN